jgi:hypothetical protein
MWIVGTYFKKNPYNLEKLATFRTQDTERRQKQTNKTPNKIQLMEMKSRVCFIVVTVDVDASLLSS